MTESSSPEKVIVPLEIQVEPYLRDHSINGQSVLSAVEILQLLAASVRQHRPEAPVRIMQSASFDRFIPIGGDAGVIEVRHELEVHSGFLRSRLTTISLTPGKAIRRTKVHAAVDFLETSVPPSPPPIDTAACLDGSVFEVSAAKLYGELVPFGPAYHSLSGDLLLAEAGAVGRLQAPHHGTPAGPLGSPFPFDGAMHLACAWGQRYRHCVAFPVGFRKRTVLSPTLPGGSYISRVFPVVSTGSALQFDIMIYSPDGLLCEDIRGVAMKDLFRGRMRPPDWVQADQRTPGPDAEEKTGPLSVIREQCRALSLVELKAVADFADRALTPFERARVETMRKKRRKDYLAGRVALKQLSRKISADRLTPASEIETLKPDGIRPHCPAPERAGAVFCSLSHDSRYAFAVAAGEPVGADVERVSERVLKTGHLYMSKEEMALAQASALGHVRAAVRIWSIKEALYKLADAPLAGTWRSVAVLDAGEHRSRLEADGKHYDAWHDEIDDHLFTIVKQSL